MMDQISEAPGAVLELRRFVLDLAMRGKLVDQDPQDEPASELLRKAKEAKDKLGAARRPVRQASRRFASQENRFKLPSGWVLSTLGDLTVKITDGAHKTPTYVDKGVPFVSVKDFSSGSLSLASTRFIPYEEHAQLYKRCDPRRGDILIGRIGTIGKAVLVNTDVEFSLFVSVGLIRFSHEVMLPEFFRMLLNSPPTEAEFDRIKIGGGTHTNKLNLSDLHSVVVALPPIAEQERIVAKVQATMELLDKVEAARVEKRKLGNRFTTSSFAKLTELAGSDVAGFVEHSRFCMDNLTRLTATDEQVEAARGVLGDLAVRGRLVQQNEAEESPREWLDDSKIVDSAGEPYSIPESWAWVRVGEIGVARLGKMLDKAKNRGVSRRYLRNVNVRWFDFDLSDVREMPIEDSEVEVLALEPGDVLVCEGGEPGRAAVWDGRETEMYFQKALHRVRFPRGVDPRYFVTVLRVAARDGRILSHVTGVTFKHLTGRGLSSLLIPLPPLLEQHRIMQRLDILNHSIDLLKAEIGVADSSRDRLLRAVLHDAIGGI
ncbi:restriction endonuclease subunit S [Micromonospora sp. NPDC023644]|uniref:restriction endonuclease subunit S n=1 Tax=Micromonospora sp. NPDC023644 TaxID=3154321 RepID=UPI0033CD0ABF